MIDPAAGNETVVLTKLANHLFLRLQRPSTPPPPRRPHPPHRSRLRIETMSSERFGGCVRIELQSATSVGALS